MKSKKRFTSLLLVAAMCVGLLTGCKSNSGSNNTTPTPNSGNNVSTPAPTGTNEPAGLPAMNTTDNFTLTYMHFDNDDLVKAVADAFMDKYPNIKVETSYIVAGDEYNNTLLNLVMAQQTPDCFMILGNCDFALSNAMLGDMTEYWENDPENKNVLSTINTAKLGYYGTDKKLATPIKFFPDAIYCDVAVFESLNLQTPSTDWTWDEMINAIKSATNTTAGTYGFNQFHSLVTYYPVSHDTGAIGEFGWDGKKFNMANWAEGVNQWAELVNQKYHAPYAATDEMEAWTGDRNMWAAYTGKLGFQVDAWWTYLNLFDTPEYRDRGMEWVPYTTPANEDGTIFGVLDFGGISTNTKHPREAYELLKWMGWGVEGWKVKLDAYQTLTDANGTPLYRMSMPCPITTDEAIWKEFQESFFPTAQTRTYNSVSDPVNGGLLVEAEEDTKYGKYFDGFFKNCKKPVPFGDCQIPGFLAFIQGVYTNTDGNGVGVEALVREQGKNAADYADEMAAKALEYNRQALDAAKAAYKLIGIDLNY